MDPGNNPIGWCSRTWNLFRGCSPVSEGCKHCYAMAEAGHQVIIRPAGAYQELAERHGGRWRWTGIVAPSGVSTWTQAFRTRQRWLAFVNSMSDIFHESMSDEAILFAFRVMAKARMHQFQVLTKRAERMATFMARLHLREGDLCLGAGPLPAQARFVGPNIWLGVTVENQRRADERLPLLAATRAVVRFVSFEPLLEHIDISQHHGSFDWAIVGGESGRDFRAMDLNWVRALRDFCLPRALPLYFKQKSGVRPAHAPELDGRVWRQLPSVALGELPSDEERKRLITWCIKEYAHVFDGTRTKDGEP